MKQVTLISLYGEKTACFSRFLGNCLEIIRESRLQRIFEPYHLDQIHGTFFGMEKIDGMPDSYNANIWTQNGKREVMKFSPLIETVRNHLPMKIRFGGFGKTFRGFRSFGKIPFERSFQIQWFTKKVTLIGWPHMGDDFFSDSLMKTLRLEVENLCNIRHKYVNDNDLYMVIGEIADRNILSQSERKKIEDTSRRVEQKVRVYLENNPIDVDIEPEKVFFARYTKESLPLDSTETYCIARAGIDEEFIRNLYR